MNTSIIEPRPRNIQLDFFRGLALLIIFINHVPANDLLLYTPSRFGFSDSAEIFVFLSGVASAMAYGRCFRVSGLWLGSVRAFYRCAEIYAAHLALFFLLAVVCILGNSLFEAPDYIDRLNIRYFFDFTPEALLALVSLRWVPNYFDILPMYLVVMLWVPIVWTLSRCHGAAALGFSLSVYLAMWLFDLELAADPHSDRPWYFNPFAWQLIFFTGFAFGSGWIKPPAPQKWLFVTCSVFVVLSIPLSHEPNLRPTDWLVQLHASLQPWTDKTRFGPLRWVHFMAVAYLVVHFFRGREKLLQGAVPRLIARMGQQSLPIFLVCMTLSYLGGMVFDQMGHDAVSITLVNLGGCLLMILATQAIAWFKSKPWKIQATSRAQAGDAIGVRGLHLIMDTPSGQWMKAVAALLCLGPLALAPLVLTAKKPIIEDVSLALSQDPGALMESPASVSADDESPLDVIFDAGAPDDPGPVAP